MKIEWKLFDGIQPRLRPHLLKQESAQRALNTKLTSGAIEQFKTPQNIQSTARSGAPKTIFRYGQSRTDENYWFDYSEDVDITYGHVADDANELVFLAGGPALYNKPRYVKYSAVGAGPTYPDSAYVYDLGIPAPGAFTFSNTGGSGQPTGVYMAYQFVTADGRRGPLSAAYPDPTTTPPVDLYPGGTADVSGLDSTLSYTFNHDITHKDIYVSAVDANGTAQFRFWKRVTLATTTTSAAVDFGLLGEVVESPTLIGPPDDLFGLMAHPGGFMVGFSGRTYCRSEVFKPHGWPSAYRDPLPDTPVGGAILGTSVVVCTNGKTYLFTGNDPLNQIKIDLEGWQPCVSKRSIKKTTFGVVYASSDGLVVVTGEGPVRVITADHFTREQWQAFKPESSHAAVHDDRYFWWWDAGSNVKGLLIFEFGGDGIQQVTESDIWAYSAFSDHRKDELYLAVPPGYLVKWDVGITNATSIWRSKLFYLDRPQNIGAVRVEAAAYPVTFRLYSNSTLVQTVTVADDRPVRLKGQRRYKDFYVELETTSQVDSLAVASSISEMRVG